MYNPIINDLYDELRLVRKGRRIGLALLFIGITCFIALFFRDNEVGILSACGILASITGLLFLSLVKMKKITLEEALMSERWKDEMRREARRVID